VAFKAVLRSAAVGTAVWAAVDTVQESFGEGWRTH
jgi:hypothetical protein